MAEKEGDNTVYLAQVDSDVGALDGSDVSLVNGIIDLNNPLLSNVGCRRGQQEGAVSSEFTARKRVQLATG